MKIKWYGHAAFNIVTDAGTRIIIDPYQSGAFGGALTYGKIIDEADIVLVSHDHDDHNYTKDIKGKYLLVEKEGEYNDKGVMIAAIPTFHDQSGGSERGKNLLFVVEADGVRVAHMGDLGHVLDARTLQRLGRIDILLIPVGGFYTIDAREATTVFNSLKPRITVPMHYKTDKCDFPIAGVEEFIRDKKWVNMAGTSEIVITGGSLPGEPEIIVLQSAL